MAVLKIKILGLEDQLQKKICAIYQHTDRKQQLSLDFRQVFEATGTLFRVLFESSSC